MNARQALRGSTVGALLLVGSLAAGHAAAEPEKTPSPVAKLINDIASIDQNLSQLTTSVAIKQQAVNKALVDFQNAFAAQQVAAATDDAARAALAKTKREVAEAQRQFDDFMRAVNRQGNNRLGAMSDYVSSDDPGRVLEQISSVEQMGRQQRATVARLQYVRGQQTKRVAATSATRKQTAAAAKGAEARRADAITAVTTARQAVSDQQTQRSQLLNQRTALVNKLDKQRGTTTPTSPPPALSDVLDKLPSTPAEGTENAAAEAAALVAKLALETGTQLLAGLIGEQQIPHSELLDELGLGGASIGGTGSDGVLSRLGNGSLGALFGGGGGGLSRPGLRGPQAIELVVNRAKSQIGVPYAWGGGNADGPTLGIRDGGVADSYGDYNKVGYDCSGLMVYAFGGVGIDLPKYTGYQYTSGPHAPLSDIRRGDMIFYGPNASAHVALYLGDGTMIEAPQSGSVVKISPLRTDGAMPNVVRML
ncbi:NlpC/P60 family protein [Gordonia phosphorivorans]|uniref:NlpC/P60 family protein n=1 Tax=Gordonia phosphorivorans TaxID=1056982 RepID=A0ABV6H9D1_9ACTN